MPASYNPPVDYNPSAGDPYVAPPDITGFDALANRAAQARTKGAGRDVINARNSYLLGSSNDQRRAIGQKYYTPQFTNNTNALFGDPGQFMNVITGGDEGFLGGLADDTGTGLGGGGGGNPGGGGNTGGGGGPDYSSQISQMQQLINTLMQNQRGGLSATQSPTLSAGSVSNAQGSSQDRARMRNSGLVNTLASRARGRRQQASPKRYF